MDLMINYVVNQIAVIISVYTLIHKLIDYIRLEWNKIQ